MTARAQRRSEARTVPALFHPRTTCVYCGARIPCAHVPPASIACVNHARLVAVDPMYAESFATWRAAATLSASSQSRRRGGAGKPRNRREERTRGLPAQRPVATLAEASPPTSAASSAARKMRGDEPRRMERP